MNVSNCIGIPNYVSVRRTYSNFICGPDGLNCWCCIRGPKKAVKRLHARSVRRTARVAVRLSVNE